jgi:non-homologous end joining protein Ku
VRPQGRGIVMYTLHHAAELRRIDSVGELNAVPSTVKPDEMKLAKQVIETFEGPLDLANYKDGKACSGSSTGKSPAKRSWRHRSKLHRESST